MGTREGYIDRVQAMMGVRLVAALAGLAACSGPTVAATNRCVAMHLAAPMRPLVIVPVKLNGKGPFHFVLDTGATTTIVGNATAKKLRLVSLPGVVGGVGAGGSFRAGASMLGSLEIGGAKNAHVLVAVTDLRQLSGFAGTTIDGFVGYNVLKSYRVTVDYPKQRVCLAT